MTKQRKAMYLARLLFENYSQVIDGVTYYYLESRQVDVYPKCRGFGMKKTIRHEYKSDIFKLIELEELILKDMQWEAKWKRDARMRQRGA